MLKKIISLLLAAMLLTGTVAGAEELLLELSDDYAALHNEENGQTTMIRPVLEQTETLEKREVPLHLMSAESSGSLALYFANGVEDIPFMDARDIPRLMNCLLQSDDGDGISYTAEAYGPMLTVRRDDGPSMTIDFYSKSVGFSDLAGFIRHPGAVAPLDIVTLGGSGTDEEPLIRHTAMFYHGGGSTTVSLGDYRIPLFLWEGGGYLPLQTVSDLLLSPWSVEALYNGKTVLILQCGMVLQQPELDALYREGEPAEKSEELAIFTYNELCMALDLYYGLKEEHGIENFDQYFIGTGLAMKLISRDPMETAEGLIDLCMSHFADGHSSFGITSFRTADREAVLYLLANYGYGGVQMNRFIDGGIYREARMKYYPEGVPGYEEIGDTAYITADVFVTDLTLDHYAREAENDPNDLVSLLIYANARIHREGSPVKNIVIDLSNNTGGMLDAAAAMISWYLGMFDLSVYHTASGARGINRYWFDALPDHIRDVDQDTVSKGYRLFCLISPVSFSCGNLVPAAFRASGRVTLLGRRSGGGACTVTEISTADGFVINLSGSVQLSTVNNGIFYSVDQGAEPDIVLTDTDHFYDREYLTRFIDQLP